MTSDSLYTLLETEIGTIEAERVVADLTADQREQAYLRIREQPGGSWDEMSHEAFGYWRELVLVGGK